MFGKRRTDRRGGYSLLGHLRRVIQTQGAGRVFVSLGGAVVLVGAMLANCSDITGPGQDTRQAAQPVAARPDEMSSAGTISTKTGPFIIPMSSLPLNNPCTGDAIVWDRGKTLMQGYTQSSTGSDGRVHIQFHFSTNGQGFSTTPVKTRYYSGSEEYDSQTFTTPTTDRFWFEWNLKMIARGEDGVTLFDGDDFVMHIKMRMGPEPTFFPPEEVSITGSNEYCR